MKLTIKILVASLLLWQQDSPSAQPSAATTEWIECEGAYGGHLQGVASDGKSIFWSHTVQLVKTDLHGKAQISIDVPSHHGDLTLYDEKVYVAVELGQFNHPPGKSNPWVYVYASNTLELMQKHPVPELVHGAGGIAFNDGRFVIVGGLPGNLEQNYAFEYDTAFNFLSKHVLFSGQTRLGIQTAHFMDDHWWFGCYGSPNNPGLLKADNQFRLIGQSPKNFSYGIAKLDRNTVLRGECFADNTRGRVVLSRNQLPQVKAVPTRIRLAAYNVLFGTWGEPDVIGEMFKPYHLDIIGFSEVPDGDWTKRVGEVLDMDHAYVGKISSANHEDKYKSILSRTPLSRPHEIKIEASGWSPASLVGAETVIRGKRLLIYSTHIPGRPEVPGSAAAIIAKNVIPQALDRSKNVVILGDLNNRPGDTTLEQIEATGMRSMWADLALNTSRLSTHQHIESGNESGIIDHIYFSAQSRAKAIRGGIIYNAFNHPDADKTSPRYKTDWKTYGKPLSDHRPIWSELEFSLE